MGVIGRMYFPSRKIPLRFYLTQYVIGFGDNGDNTTILRNKTLSKLVNDRFYSFVGVTISVRHGLTRGIGLISRPGE